MMGGKTRKTPKRTDAYKDNVCKLRFWSLDVTIWIKNNAIVWYFYVFEYGVCIIRGFSLSLLWHKLYFMFLHMPIAYPSMCVNKRNLRSKDNDCVIDFTKSLAFFKIILVMHFDKDMKPKKFISKLYFWSYVCWFIIMHIGNKISLCTKSYFSKFDSVLCMTKAYKAYSYCQLILILIDGLSQC